MDKKWVFSGLVIIFIAANLFFWLPVDAQEECPRGKKCFFNYAGTLMLQATGGDIELFTNGDSKDGGNIKLDISGSKSASNIFLKTQESGESNIYLNYFTPDHYGLAVTANGGLYHDSFSVLVADGGYYDINIDGISKGLSLIRSEVTPGQIDSSRQVFVASDSYYYWGAADPTIGLSSLYADVTNNLFGQLAFIRSGHVKVGTRQYLQYRFNDIDSPRNWGQWVEMCDNSNNCRNFLNILDETSNGSLLVYQDPDLLMDAGLKIDDPTALANCDALNTSGGVIGCGSGGTGGGVSGSGTINYIPKWSSTSSLANSTIFDNGNVGIGTTTPDAKLDVNGSLAVRGPVSLTNQLYIGQGSRLLMVDNSGAVSVTSTISGANKVTFVGTTTASHNGNQGGYDSANGNCASIDSGSHICTTEDILKIVNNGGSNTLPTTTDGLWISNGPPGFTVNSNDCIGFSTSSNDVLGTVWIKVNSTKYFGAVRPCGLSAYFACCK